MFAKHPLTEQDVLLDAINVTQGAWVVERTRVLHTILGSCVSVCLFDPFKGLGGMNHYVYPPRGSESATRFSNTTYSGDICMEGLLEAMLRGGAKKGSLRAKAFGGGKMFEHEDVLTIGKRNTSFAKFWLGNAGIPLELCDFHGAYTRKLIFHPGTGHHLCQRLPTTFQIAP